LSCLKEGNKTIHIILGIFIIVATISFSSLEIFLDKLNSQSSTLFIAVVIAD
jgi:hypothetical protein